MGGFGTMRAALAFGLLASLLSAQHVDAVGDALTGEPVSAPGAWFSIYGDQLATNVATGGPSEDGSFPTSLIGVRVHVGERLAYLYYVSPGQINALIPSDLAAGVYAGTVETPDGISNSFSLEIRPVSPGIFPGGVVRTGTFAPITEADPAKAGDVLILFASGLGAVTPAVPPGQVGPADPLSYTVETPLVSVGKVQAEVLYSILAPGFLGVYQVAIVVPPGIRSGEIPVVVSAAGHASNAVPIYANGDDREDLAPQIESVRSSVAGKTGDRYRTGSLVQVDVTEATQEGDLASGTIRIASESQAYDSGERPLTLDPITFLWDTAGLDPADDYIVTVTLEDQAGQTGTDASLRLTLAADPPSPRRLVAKVDLTYPAPGLPLLVARAYSLDSRIDGPFGFGWSLNYQMYVSETDDGRVGLREPDGTGSYFTPDEDGGYRPPPGDYRMLTRIAGGGFELRTKGGTVYRFDEFGWLQEIRDRSGNALQPFYDERGRLAAVATAASGQSVRFEYNQANRIGAAIDPNGRRVSYEYDAAGNLTAVTDIGAARTVYTYDAAHNLTSVTSPSGLRTEYSFDEEGRLIEILDVASGSSTTYRYDPDLPEVEVTDPAGNQTLTVYDHNGLPVEVRDPLGNTTRISYDAARRPVRVTDAKGNLSELTYDEFGNLKSAKNALGQQTFATYETTFQFPRTITDPLGRTTSFEYDSAGNRTAIVYPTGARERFSFDRSGNLVSATDRAGQTITYGYDSRGRLVSKLYPDGWIDSFEYDAYGNLTTATGRTGRIRHTYDASDRLVSVTDANGQTVRYQYDVDGILTQLSYPDGTEVRYIYNALREVEEIRVGARTLARYTYDSLGRVVGRSLENGTSTALTYDALGRLASLGDTDAAMNVLTSFTYTYDSVGNLLRTVTPEGTTEYFYDAINQLTRVSYPAGNSTSYDLDPLGNRTVVEADGQVQNYSTNPLNQYTSVDDEKLSYDANGNLISRVSPSGTTTYTYDFDNRLVRVDQNGDVTTFTYDPLGRRASKSGRFGTIQYVYDGLDVILERAPGGATLARYIHGIGVDDVLLMERDGRRYYYHQDSLGSVVRLTDDAGAVVESYSYDAYGNANRVSAVGNPYLFTGRRFDNEIGLYYFRARYYDAGLGRFLSVDPLDSGTADNAYTYVANNPVVFTDPTGLLLQGDVGGLTTLYCNGVVATGPCPNGKRTAAIWINPGLDPTLTVIAQAHEETHKRLWEQYGLWDTVQQEAYAYYGTVQLFLATGAYLSHWADYVFVKAALAQLLQQAGPGFDPTKPPAPPPSPPTEPPPPTNPPGTGPGTGTGTGNPPPVGTGDPSFVQPSTRALISATPGEDPQSDDSLYARIDVPYADALVRGDVPVFGIAGGTNFASYRVEYGAGADPSEWELIAGSEAAQDTPEINTAIFQGDTTVYGNLATWDTGLKSYVYLPQYPADHPVNLQGEYTVRLVVTGADGAEIEDRVTVEVGEVIPNAWGGVVRSTDNLASLEIPEQALTDSFRAFSIKPLESTAGPSPDDRLAGTVYEFREGGDRFMKPARVRLPAPDGRAASPISIAVWSESQQSWVVVPTKYDAIAGQLVTEVSELRTYYSAIRAQSPQRHHAPAEHEISSVTEEGVLVANTFEAGTGQWSNRDGPFGAQVSVDRSVTLDGSGVLKVTAGDQPGNFAVNVVTEPFDVREFAHVQFDYRVGPQVKTNFLVKVAGRWYEIRFTDDVNNTRYQRVNLASLGSIAGIQADDNWHTARFNLRDMLATHTGHFIVEEMIMANWDVDGFMKLAPGQSQGGAAYYIDNFTIGREPRPGLQVPDGPFVLDDFDRGQASNALGGAWTPFSQSGSLELTHQGGCLQGACLELTYDVTEPGSFAGAASTLESLDLRGFQSLQLTIAAEAEVLVGLRDMKGNESKVPLSNFDNGATGSGGWRTIRIPFTAFPAITDWGHLENLSLTFESGRAGAGTALIDEIRFQRTLTGLTVDSFDDDIADSNGLGRPSSILTSGSAAVSATQRQLDGEGVLRLSYGGGIGEVGAFDGEALSYGFWRTELGGLDCSACEVVSFRIRGGKGGEDPHIYLDDGNHRWGLNVSDYATVSTDWTDVEIPVRDFLAYGVDLTHLQEMQVVFEWENVSGTVYLDRLELR